MFVRFLLVGGIGFLVDSAALYALMALGLGPVPARIPAFLVAALATWALHRVFTFPNSAGAGGAGLASYVGYALATSVGMLLNFLVYWKVLHLLPPHSMSPLAALASGSGVALIFNFLVSKRWIFR